MLRICHSPAFNRVWTDLNASQAFDYSTQDFDTCWKGSCFVGKVLAKPRLQLKLTVVSGIPTTAPQKYACTLPFTLQCLSRYIQAFVWATKAYVPELRPYHQFAPVSLFILFYCQGMGHNSCMNQAGYWHYPAISTGCSYWSESFPEEIFSQEFSGSDQIYTLLRKHTDVLFSSS